MAQASLELAMQPQDDLKVTILLLLPPPPKS